MLVTSDKHATAEMAKNACARGRTTPHGKPSICFVALNAFNVLSDRQDLHHVGGAEVQQRHIASWLVRQGYSVKFITLDHGQPDGTDLDGIRVFKAYAEKAGIRGLRFFHPRWSGLWAAMARADADVYYQRGPECETGLAALWCHLHRRKFIFAAANALGCDPQLLRQEPWQDRIFYRIGVGLADAVIAQTTAQQELFHRNMGIQTTLVRNIGGKLTEHAPCETPSIDDAGPLRVLWAGRISKVKRFEWLLDVAERCPNIIFDVVGAPGKDSDYGSSLVRRAGGMSNVQMHGYVPYAEMTRYYQHCHVLCCTSPHEGFPNTFLEAWSLGVPVVSTFDPDGVIAANGLGWVARDAEEIVACLTRLRQTPEIWTEASQAARQYYRANHTPEACLPAFERLLLQVAGCESN
jgi:glycosyltransferase involved in cell wall biosynthesis